MDVKRLAIIALLLSACSPTVGPVSESTDIQIESFRLLDLPWTAYCDLYQNADQSEAGQAVFASQFNSPNPKYVFRFDGEMRELTQVNRKTKDANVVWSFANEIYQVGLVLSNSSDVPEIQKYTGKMTVSRGHKTTAIDVFGNCSS